MRSSGFEPGTFCLVTLKLLRNSIPLVQVCLGEWKVSKTPPPNGKIKPWVIKIKKTNSSKTVNKVNTKTTLKCPKVSQGKCTTYYFLISIQLITKQFPDKRTTRQTKSSKFEFKKQENHSRKPNLFETVT